MPYKIKVTIIGILILFIQKRIFLKIGNDPESTFNFLKSFLLNWNLFKILTYIKYTMKIDWDKQNKKILEQIIKCNTFFSHSNINLLIPANCFTYYNYFFNNYKYHSQNIFQRSWNCLGQSKKRSHDGKLYTGLLIFVTMADLGNRFTLLNDSFYKIQIHLDFRPICLFSSKSMTHFKYNLFSLK